jgi:hypothetical protein
LSDANGYFAFSVDALDETTAPSPSGATEVEVAVSAAGYGRWTISRARYYARDTLRLYPRLNVAGHGDTHVTAASPRSEAVKQSSLSPPLVNKASSQWGAAQNAGLSSVQLSANGAAGAIPVQIRVYRTATGEVEVVPFKEYTKHVLSNEWISSWGQASLRAGAMAVKGYAWFWIARGGKQAALGADLKDNTDDQVYDPNVSYASTDAAVDATWQYSMTINGALFQASYCAGSYQADPSSDCPWGTMYMTQWGSKYYSDQGRSWSWIVQFYYRDAVISPTPPGGNSSPPPPPSAPPSAPPVPVGGPAFAVGQGAVQQSVFQEAYDRNGGAAVLGRPTGEVHWWLPYVSENNVLAQPFSGGASGATMWIVFDTLKNNISGTNRAYLLSGEIANAYASNNPAGPEWVGAPTSDPYVAPITSGGFVSQGFARGTLSFNGTAVQFTPWPAQFGEWKAEYFAGKPPAEQNGPAISIPGQPANVIEVAVPNMNWPAGAAIPQSLGVGSHEWSAQFSRVLQVAPGSYDFVVNSDAGVRLWIDGLLAINAWSAQGPHRETYNADLDSGPHEIRLQYYSPANAALLDFSMTERGKSSPPASAPPAPSAGQDGDASLRIKVQWLGRSAAPNDRWSQPLTLLLSAPNNPAILGTYQGTTDRNGVALYSNLPAGTYDVHVKGVHTLQSAKSTVVLASNRTVDVDMKALVEGDLDGDNCVTVDDFAIVQALVGTDMNTPGYNPAADLDGDGMVTVADMSLLRSGFDRCGDISADNELTVYSTDGAPTAAQALAPWLQADSLPRDLSLDLVSSATTLRVGEVVQVAVVGSTRGQAIDGGSFLLNYDPAAVVPVDSSGNPATLSEPGLALPSVLTNWVDTKGGAIGYAAGMLQGEAPSGSVVLTTLRFKALRAGPTSLAFRGVPSPLMQLTNGGTNLLGSANGLSLSVTP